MDISLIITLAVIGVVVVYFISLYNHLVQLKHGVSKAWSNIDVLLKQRHDELPKLVETCKQHMGYEQNTLTAVMEARSAVASAREQGDVGALGKAETQLRMGLGNLFAVAEDYPELRASDSFMHLHSRITGLESGIADRREYYNDSVNHLNVRIEQFPDVIIARRFGFKPAELLEFDEADKADVNLGQLFG
ncbi:LemA family protein [Marinobacterium sp. AK62]|uniref:LemA family protein n=1 Tax=Marinobacterium alkalitolerans TaxID=1542925 RepID=A0ABS3ZBM8_9GAMM|nr:LemA family protein [Marinobacterium alkalitolerans]MBP0049117.1 LemA family protein [Marinobacterium alkalitolerans]